MSTRAYDYVIIGQGLAGTTLAWRLWWAGRKVLLVDREAAMTASRVAAGLVTPITGTRLVTTWRLPELWPAARTFYERVEHHTKVSVFQPTSAVRLFQNREERACFQRRCQDVAFRRLIADTSPVVDRTRFANELGGFEMAHAGRLDVDRYLDTSRDFFRAQDSYLHGDLDLRQDLELHSEGIRIPSLRVTAEKCIFCQGVDAAQNPWFQDLRFEPVTGQVMTLQIPELTEQRVIHRGVWLLPRGGECFQVGSTYEPHLTDPQVTNEGRKELVARLREFLRVPFDVVDQSAALRPIVRGRLPVVGLHPEFPQLGLMNGLGSKGALRAPYFAKQFAEFLVGKQIKLDREVRFDVRFASTAVSSGRIRMTKVAHDHVRATLRPGETAVDATAGNGNDTAFLAELVGARGRVFALDVQLEALDRTARRLGDRGWDNVALVCCDHAMLLRAVPQVHHGAIGAVMLNLGYLPGGDKQRTTRIESTVAAIQAGLALLRPGGILTVLAYTGHPGGRAEAEAVETLLVEIPRTQFEVAEVSRPRHVNLGPRLFIARRVVRNR